MIGKIAVSAAVFAIDKPYSYRVPEGMELLPGHRVQLPFGRANKMSEGIVLSVEAGDETGLKEVARVLDDAPMLTRRQLQLAAFLRERYFCTYFDAARAMLPAGAWFHTRVTFSLTTDRSWSAAAIRKEGARDILKLLETLGGEAQESSARLPPRTRFSPPRWNICCARNGSPPSRTSAPGSGTRPSRWLPWPSPGSRHWILPPPVLAPPPCSAAFWSCWPVWAAAR